MASSPEHLRVPPQHLESEKALLGSVMLKPDVLHDVVDLVSAQAFYSDKHRKIFQAMLELFGKGDPIDLLSLSTKLEEKKQLEQIGGRSYLNELVAAVPSAANARHYAEIVQRKYTLRRLIEAADTITKNSFDEPDDIDVALDEAEKSIFEVANMGNSQRIVDLKDSLGEAWERFERLHENRGELRGVPSGFQELDNKLAGFQKADLIILAARPSMGKTALALDIARLSATKHKTPVGIFSLEMSSQQLVDRLLAAESKVDAWKLRTGKLSVDDEFGRIRDALDNLSKAPIYIDDQPGNTILKMRSVARKLKSEKGLGLLIVDYLQLMMPTSGKFMDSMVQQVTEISRGLKQLARELDVPVLALSQLSRAVESRGGKPRLSDLRDSGSLEQDADVVMFIHREDKYKDDSDKPNIAEILIEKHRNGPTGKVELYFDDQKATFLSIEKSDFSDLADAAVEEDVF